GPGRVANGLLLAGALAALALYLLLLDVLALSGNGDLRRGVRAKLQAEGIDPEATGGVFVAFAPAAEPLLYEGSGPWDLPLLPPAGDRLAYVGEQARFVLTHEHVRKLRLAPGVPSWLRTRRVALTWHDPATGAGGTVAVWPCDSGTVLRQRRATVELARRLSA